VAASAATTKIPAAAANVALPNLAVQYGLTVRHHFNAAGDRRPMLGLRTLTGDGVASAGAEAGVEIEAPSISSRKTIAELFPGRGEDIVDHGIDRGDRESKE
jgi:hypothetical protein